MKRALFIILLSCFFSGNDDQTSCADSSCQVKREGTTQHVCRTQWKGMCKFLLIGNKWQLMQGIFRLFGERMNIILAVHQIELPWLANPWTKSKPSPRHSFGSLVLVQAKNCLPTRYSKFFFILSEQNLFSVDVRKIASSANVFILLCMWHSWRMQLFDLLVLQFYS